MNKLAVSVVLALALLCSTEAQFLGWPYGGLGYGYGLGAFSPFYGYGTGLLGYGGLGGLGYGGLGYGGLGYGGLFGPWARKRANPSKAEEKIELHETVAEKESA